MNAFKNVTCIVNSDEFTNGEDVLCKIGKCRTGLIILVNDNCILELSQNDDISTVQLTPEHPSRYLGYVGPITYKQAEDWHFIIKSEDQYYGVF